MNTRWIAALLLPFFLAAVASAHGPKLGPNGGPVVHAGDYHVEMTAKGTALTVYLLGDDEKPVTTKGFKGTGIFAINGKPVRIELTPDGQNKLVGQSTVPLTKSPKGAVRITTPSGKTAQAKFE